MKIETTTSDTFQTGALAYLNRLTECFSTTNLEAIETLAKALLQAWIDGRNVYICGNGGSAANAIHMANDFHYGIGACGPKPQLPGLRVEALAANPGVITCLANDAGYENIYSLIASQGRQNDLLIVLSGGNSLTLTGAC